MSSVIRTAAKSLFSLVDLGLGAFPGPRILIYHQIGAGNGKQMDLSLGHFSRHIDHLAGSDLRVIPLDDAVSQRGASDADGTVVLTFDDGYDDMYRNAYPLLRENGLPFTLYVTSEPAETGRPLSDDGKSQPATWDQINEMQESGLMTLGAHTHTHPDFRNLTVAQAEEEIGRSQELIEKRTGQVPRHFAYPWGYWADATDGAVRDTYETATLGGGRPIDANSDLLRLNRIPIQLDDGFAFFKKKLIRGQRTEERIRRKLAGYDGP